MVNAEFIYGLMFTFPIALHEAYATCSDHLSNGFHKIFKHHLIIIGKSYENRAGPGNLNNPISVETAPEGEDLACEDWSKDEQKTPQYALSGIQS